MSPGLADAALFTKYLGSGAPNVNSLACAEMSLMPES